LQREAQYARPEADDETTGLAAVDGWVVSLTCAVSPSDWKDALEYASRSPRILPALGIHPWYLGDIMVVDDDIENPNENCGDGGCVMNYINWDWLTDLETHLSEHPRLLVGEIGLCRMARFVREFPKDRGGKAAALELQKLVFSRQLELAARYSRPVTVHCVDAHGIFMEVLWEIFRRTKDLGRAEGRGGDEGEGATKQQRRVREAFPPAIAMHSFTGTAHHVDEIMAFERVLLRPEGGDNAGGQPIEDSDERGDVMFYFGFSHSVNHLMCTSEKARRRGTEAVRSVPSDRLLVESDVHASIDVTLGTAGAVAYAAHVRGERIEDLAERCVVNGLRFLSSLGSMTTTSSS
jgi:TatD DNase family protein